MGGLLYYLALVFGVFAFALLAPAAVGMLSGENNIAALFLVMAGLTGFLSGAVFFGVRGRDLRVGRVTSFILAMLIWIVPALGAALPFVWIAGLNYPAALFEAVSGYTTTGATVFTDIDMVPRTLVFWRAELQWLGGLMTLVMVITILGPAGLGGLPSGQVGMIQATSRSNTVHSLTVVRDIFAAYALISLLCVLALLVCGIPLFDSLCLAFSTISTGGFTPRNGWCSVRAGSSCCSTEKAIGFWASLLQLDWPTPSCSIPDSCDLRGVRPPPPLAMASLPASHWSQPPAL